MSADEIKPIVGQERRGERVEKRGYVQHYINMRDTQVPTLCQELCSESSKPSQLKQILRSNVKPIRRGSVINYSANQGLPRRTRSSKSSDASNTPQTQRNPLQKAVNTIHFQAADGCLFIYQQPARMLWKTENDKFFALHLDTSEKGSATPRVALPGVFLSNLRSLCYKPDKPQLLVGKQTLFFIFSSILCGCGISTGLQHVSSLSNHSKHFTAQVSILPIGTFDI